MLCAFVLHRRFVFRVRGGVWLDLARFELVNLGALAANAVVLPILVEWAGSRSFRPRWWLPSSPS